MSRLIPEAALAVFQAEGVNRHGIEGEKQGEDYRNREFKPT